VLAAVACNRERGGTPAGASKGIVDNELRGYIEQGLRPYLTSIAKVACATRVAAAPKAGRYEICVPATAGQGVEPLEDNDPRAEGVTIPPKDGKPFPRPDTLRGKVDTIDNEVSEYIENKLRPYLASLGKVICAVRSSAAPTTGAYGLCPPGSKTNRRARPPTTPEAAETLPPPPKDRMPDPNAETIPTAPDNEVRTYIESHLRPYLTSLAKVACSTRAFAAPKADRNGVCVPFTPGAENVVALDQGPREEGVTIPPKNGRPYPSPEPGPPGDGPPRQ
jgi:hypothetical protein